MDIKFEHKPVMLNEVLSGLNINPDGIYIDCTLGGGGHSERILEKLSANGMLIGLDKDQDALDYTNNRLKHFPNLKTFHTDFKAVEDVVDYLELQGIDGVLLDLGVSSYQLDTPHRGFSFRFDSPLDMRMDKTQKLTAYDIVNTYTYEQLVKILFEYGEEEFAKQIAKNIITKRQEEPIKTTKQLCDIIESSMPKKVAFKRGGAHKKTFQAIRIEVNHELDILENALRDAFELLNVGGRLSVISFHSLEDKIVSKVFKDLCSDDESARKLPITPEHLKARAKKIIKITPSEKELDDNNRSRSSKLRVIERVR